MFSALKKIFKSLSPKPKVYPQKNGTAHKDKSPEVIEKITPDAETGPVCEEMPPSAEIPAKTSEKTVHSPEKRKRKKSGISDTVNRHGIPVLKSDSDLAVFLKEEPENSSGATPDQPGNRLATHRKISGRPPRPRNRNGIPLFEDDVDFSVFFRDRPEDDFSRKDSVNPGRTRQKACGPPDDSFEALLEASLSGKDAATLLLEKGHHLPHDRPATTAEKLRFYPLPQEEIDLHGYTSEEALAKTSDFINKARYKGKRTLLIIVGKGLHSEGVAVLPDVVEAQLSELKQKGWVLAYEWEKGRKRKSGAIIVYLNAI